MLPQNTEWQPGSGTKNIFPYMHPVNTPRYQSSLSKGSIGNQPPIIHILVKIVCPGNLSGRSGEPLLILQ